MALERDKKPEKKEQGTKVGYYYRFKSTPMVFIEGNFMKGGFSLSKNKVKAVLDNLDELRRFAAGEYDTDITALEGDDDILRTKE